MGIGSRINNCFKGGRQLVPPGSICSGCVFCLKYLRTFTYEDWSTKPITGNSYIVVEDTS